MDNHEGVKSVDLALDILELVADAGKEIGVSAVAKKFSVSKTTIFRHLQTLTNRGYLEKNPVTSKYSLGRAVSALQPLQVNPVDLLALAMEEVRSLASRVGQTVVLSSVSHAEVTVIHTELGRAPIEIGVRVGSRLPLHSTAQGKMALAYCPELLEKVDLAALTPYTEFTIVTEQDLLLELERARRRGCISAPEEMTLGINAVAAPIFDASHHCIGVLAVVGSIQFVRRQIDEDLCKGLVAAAEAISASIGASMTETR